MKYESCPESKILFFVKKEFKRDRKKWIQVMNLYFFFTFLRNLHLSLVFYLTESPVLKF